MRCPFYPMYAVSIPIFAIITFYYITSYIQLSYNNNNSLLPLTQHQQNRQAIYKNVKLQFEFKQMSKDKESICVTVRVRPLSNKQLEEDTRICLRVDEYANMISMSGPNSERQAKDFYFDSVCDANNQHEMFQKVGKRSTMYCMEGYNCTIFAYGQTGAGKTYTMMGLNPEHRDYFQQRGLVPRTLQHLFQCIEKQISQIGVDYIIKCSFVEIYNEQIIDLLGTGSSALNIREDLKKGVYIEGVTQEIISQSEQAMEILRKGSKGRHVGSTFYNQTSSRSHSVFTMQIESQQLCNGIKSTKSRHFHFIDLAGSQRTKKSMGDRLKEGCSINKSLHVLSTVISSLAEISEGKNRHVNYRDSKLTFLLKDSLGGNSKTHLIANISPSLISSQETKSTLMFARKVKLIKVNKVSINEDASGNLQSLKAQIRRLRSENLLLRNGNMSIINNPSNGNELSTFSHNSNNSKMVTVLQQYVDQELQKQTQMQLEITKLTNKNAHLQKGIKHFNDNQKQLRMVISIYEDKIKKLKKTESLLLQQVHGLAENNKIQQIKEYFTSERQSLLEEIDKYKKLSESSTLVKNLLRQLKAIKQNQESIKEEDNLINILAKNNEFLSEIKSSIKQLEPDVQQGKASKIVIAQNQELKTKNQQLIQIIQKHEVQLAEVRDKIQQSETLLGQAISTQISLQKKIDQDKKNHILEIQQYQKQFNQLKVSHQKTQTQLKNQTSKSGQLQLINSQLQLQNYQLKSELKTIKDKKQIQDVYLKEKIENLTQQNIKLQQNIKRKIQQIQKWKNQSFEIKSESQRNKQEINNILGDAHIRIQQLEEQSTKLESQKVEMKIKLQKEHELLEMKLTTVLKENNDWINKYEQSCVQIRNYQQQISKQTNQILIYKEKLQQHQRSHQQQKLKWEQNHNQLVKMINQKKACDSQTQGKLTEAQLQIIGLNEKLSQITIQYKKSIESIKFMESSANNRISQLEEQLNQKSTALQQLKSDHQESKRKIQVLNEGEHAMKRQNKLLEEQINFKGQQYSKIFEQLQKTKKKQKQVRISVNELKNEMYAMKKNYEIQLQCLRDQLRVKQDDFNSLMRENQMLKQASEKSMLELQKKMQTQFDIFKQNQGSIKKAMQAHLMNKQKKINELKSAYDSIEAQFQNKSNDFQNLLQVLEKIKIQLQQQTKNNTQLQKQKIELQQSLLKYQQNLNMLEGDHIKAVEDMENNFNQQLDFKNAEIQKLRKQCEIFQNQIKINQGINIQKDKLKAEIMQRQSYCQQLLEINQSLKREKQNLQNKFNEINDQLINRSSRINEQQQQFKMALQQEVLNKKLLQNEIKQKQNLIQKLDSALQNLQIQMEQLHRLNSKLAEQKQNGFKKFQEIINNKTKQSQNILIDFNTLSSQNRALQDHVHVLETEYHKSLDHCKQLQNQVANLNQNLQNVTINLQKMVKQNQKYKQQYNCLNLQMQKTIKQNQNTNITSRTQLQRQKNQKYNLDQKMKKLIQDNDQMQHGLNQLNIIIQRKQKQIQNLQQHLSGIQKRAEIQEKQFNDQLKSLYENSTQQTNNLNKLYEQSKLKLESMKKENQVLQQSYHNYRKSNDFKMLQLENQTKYQSEALKKSQTQFMLEKGKVQELQKYTQEQSHKLHTLQHQRDRLNEDMQQLKKQAQRKLKQSEKKCLLGASQMNSLREQIKFIQQEAKNWKIRMEELETQIRNSNEIAEKFRIQYTRQKESNKEFKLLLDNAHCQIQSFKNEVMDKDKLYHQLLQKVSKNDIERKGLLNQDKKFSDLLQKSRIQVSELRKKYDDQLKINNLLKQQLEKKDVDVSLVKQRSEQYCRKQQQLMESIRSDYTKIQSQLKTTQQALNEARKVLKKVTQKNEQLQQRVQKANKECIQAQTFTDELKKQSLRTGIDERQTNYVNKLKQENTQLKRQLQKTSEQLISINQEKLRLKSEMRHGSLQTPSLELNKRISQVKYLQKIIDDSISVLGIKDYKKSVGQSLKYGILELQRQVTKSKSDIAQLNEQMALKNQKLQILENQKLRITPKQQDDTLTKMRNKINRTTSNFEAIRQSKQEDKLILQSKDQNKVNLWGLNKP